MIFVTLQFPAIADHIFGEESNTFSNTLGDTITVEVQADQTATATLLSTVCRSVISYFYYPVYSYTCMLQAKHLLRSRLLPLMLTKICGSLVKTHDSY